MIRNIIFWGVALSLEKIMPFQYTKFCSFRNEGISHISKIFTSLRIINYYMVQNGETITSDSFIKSLS